MDLKKGLIITILYLLNQSFGANILVIQPYPHYSQLVAHFPIFRELIRCGHNLTIFTPKINFYRDFGNISLTLHHFTYIHYNDDSQINYKDGKWNIFEQQLIHDLNYKYLSHRIHLFKDELKDLYLSPKNYNFDLIMMDSESHVYDLLAEIYDCPIVLLRSYELDFGSHNVAGNGANPSIHSDIYTMPNLHAQLNYYERVKSHIVYFFFYIKANMIEEFSKNLRNEVLPTINNPVTREILHKRLGFTMNILDITTTSIRPTYNLEYTGFIAIEDNDVLKPDYELRNIMKNSKQGFILMHLEFIEDLSDEVLQNFLGAFNELSYNVIWKFERSKFKWFYIPENVFIVKSLPYQDVLAHPNIKLVITNGGTRAVEEAIDREIPMIFIPVSHDQPFSAALFTKLKLGVTVDINRITKKSLDEAFEEVLKDEYTENVKKYRKFMFDKLMTGFESVNSNIEFLLNHKDVYHYQAYEARSTGYFIKYFVDIYLIFLTIFGIFLGIIKYIEKITIPRLMKKWNCLDDFKSFSLIGVSR